MPTDGSARPLVNDAIVAMVPNPRGPLRGVYPVREISLGRHAPKRQIAFVCRAADADNRRVAALREAFEHAYALAKN